MDRDEPRSALIVGAGIGGLAAGVALRRAGWNVRIHERSRSPQELGFALLLAPNAMAALDELDLGEAVRAAGVSATRFEVRYPDGRVIRRFRAQPGGRMIVALRPVLHGALLSAVVPMRWCPAARWFAWHRTQSMRRWISATGAPNMATR